MKYFALAAAVAAAFPCIAAAEAGAADPAAPVPAQAYRSVFQGLPTGLGDEQSDWRSANADVARFPRGHADYLKCEEQQQGAGTAAPARAATPASAPAPSGAPAPAPRPQGGHRQHH